MQDLRQKLDLLLSNTISDRSESEYKKLISFIDAAISQVFKIPEEERSSFLTSNIISMRDYMQSEIITKSITSDARVKVLHICDNHFISKEQKEAEIKKKELDSHSQNGQEESISETDQSTSQKREES